MCRRVRVHFGCTLVEFVAPAVQGAVVDRLQQSSQNGSDWRQTKGCGREMTAGFGVQTSGREKSWSVHAGTLLGGACARVPSSRWKGETRRGGFFSIFFLLLRL